MSAVKAIAAHVDYVKYGEGMSKNFGFGRHLFTSMTLGIGLGLVWKVRHVGAAHHKWCHGTAHFTAPLAQATTA